MTTTTTNELAAALEKSIGSVTKGWTEAKRHADRQQRVSQRALADLRRARRPPKLTIKAAAWQVMERAYRKASAGGTLPANARQIMYAARPLVLELTGGECWKNSATFTQQLLPGFIEAYPGRTAGWNVAYDARGRLVEPHTGDRTDLGTLEVRSYVRAWVGKVPPKLDITLRHACPTRGPANRYRFALFIEKEGFYPLLEAAGIANRFDLAIMSTKGMSVTAARELVDQLSAYGVTLLVAHDFDKAGFAILHTLQQWRKPLFLDEEGEGVAVRGAGAMLPVGDVLPHLQRPQRHAPAGVRLDQVAAGVVDHIPVGGQVRMGLDEVGQQLLRELCVVLPDPPAGQLEHERPRRVHDLPRMSDAGAAAGVAVRLLHHMPRRVFDRPLPV